MSVTADVLLFVEDPGAANFVCDLPEALLSQNLTCKVFSSGKAGDFLTNRKKRHFSTKHPIAANLIEELKPRLIIVGTSENRNSFAFDLIDEGKRRSILTIGAVDMAVNADSRFQGNSSDPLKHAPDLIVVPDNSSLNAFLKIGFCKDKIFVIGNPHYDYVVEQVKGFESRSRDSLRKAYFPKARADELVVAFLCQPESALVKGLLTKSEDYSLQGWGKSNKRNDIVLEELIDSIKKQQVEAHFGVRLHPKNTLSEFDRYSSFIDFVSIGGDPLEFVFACDFLIGMSTMLLFEAALMNKPTLSILPRKSELGWLPDGAEKAITSVWNRDSLNQTLKEKIKEIQQGEWSKNNVDYTPGALTRFSELVVGMVSCGN